MITKESEWRLLTARIVIGTSLVAQLVKNPPTNAKDTGESSLIPKSGRSAGDKNGNPLQYSCLRNPMDRGACGQQSKGLQRVKYEWACTLY